MANIKKLFVSLVYLDKMDTNKKAALEMLEKTHGIVSSACISANIARSTFYLWCNEDPDFKAAVDEINEGAIDFVESKLIEKIDGIAVQTYNSKGEPVIYEQPPSDTAIIFFLKTRGKKRGYVEKTDLNISGALGLMDEPVIFE